MGKGISIDFGAKRTGIAITDSQQMIAFGLTTISTHNIDGFLSNLFENDDISYVVVGDPVNLDGSSTDITPHVKGFVKRLRKTYPHLPVYLIDERFTSKIAKQAVLSSKVRKKVRMNKELVDEISATILLQSYLYSNSKKE